VACLFGRDWSRAELLAHVGDIGQVAGVRLVSLVEGAENGLRAAELRTGDGLTATVYLDRGMDIGPTEYRGAPLAWVSPTGAPGPS
jgi:hypothetical protein